MDADEEVDLSSTEMQYVRLYERVEETLLRRMKEACSWIKDMRDCDTRFRNPRGLLRSQHQNCKQCLTEAKMLADILIEAHFDPSKTHPGYHTGIRAEAIITAIREIALTVYSAQSYKLEYGVADEPFTPTDKPTIGDLIKKQLGTKMVIDERYKKPTG